VARASGHKMTRSCHHKGAPTAAWHLSVLTFSN
jgi:hypothetical protein